MHIKNLFILFSFFFFPTLFPSFPANTVIKTEQTSICLERISVQDVVACVGTDGTLCCKMVTHKQAQRVQRYMTIVLDDDVIITTVDQKLFLPVYGVFKEAKQLKAGDLLLAYSGEHVVIRDAFLVEEEREFFDITVDECHNFFVSRSEVLVHNMVPVAIGFTWAFGAGAIEFSHATMSACVLGAMIGIKAYRDTKQCNYGFDVDLSYNDAQAPGKPTEKDGYVPPKNWDGKKVKHSKTGQHGYPDKKGNVWVPTGPGPLAHRGPHWDVIDPKGKHKNVLPGGRVC